jgi:succinyl-diaminopimelate desuccinylase
MTDPDLVATLEWLVNTPSVTGDEDELCTQLEQRFGPDRTTRIGNSLVVGVPTGRPMVTLYGHTDTVPEQGNGVARRVDDRLFGLGASDMKSGDAVMIHLLEDPEIAAGAYDLVGVFYDKEEGPSAENGLEAVLDAVPWLMDAELAVVMEPTDLHLELGCNGVMNADVVFTGHAAHSARPWHGENAITKAGAWLAELHAREPEPVDVDGLVYREVFSVTRASGGIANNVLPAEFTINLNYRFPPIYNMDQAEARLREVAATADRVDVRDRAPSGLVPESNPLVNRLLDATGVDPMAKQGWTDVARLTSRGVDAVNYGPGEVAQCHQATESVPIANLPIAFHVLKKLLVS